MKKYRFFGNRKTFGPHKEEHPSIEIGINNGKWENIEITSSPTKNEKFTAFDENPNPNWRGKDENGKPLKPSYFRNYLRKDSIKDRLNEYTKYSLIESDECKIDKFLEERQRNIELDKARRKAAIKRKQTKMMQSYVTNQVVVQLVDALAPRHHLGLLKQ